MPQLIETLEYRTGSDGEYWSRFGFDRIVVPEDCPNVRDAMPYMTNRFNTKFKFRMIGSETMELWQNRLQDTFDSEVYRLERGLRLYASTVALMEDPVGYSEHFDGTTKDSGSDTRTERSRYSDTPDTAINEGDDYASSMQKDDATATYGKQVARGYDIRRIDNTRTTEAVNLAYTQWVDMKNRFVDRFSDCFMNVWFY